MSRTRLVIFAIVCALIGVGALATFWYNRPTTVTIAVGPAGSEAARLVDALRLALYRERSSVRLRIVPSDSPSDSAAKIERGEVDLAIIRHDIAFPTAAQVIAIWQRNPVVLTAPADRGIERWTDLGGKTIGVLGRGAGFNITLVQRILREHGVQPSTVRIVEVAPWEAGDAIRHNMFDALVTIGPVSARPVADAVSAVVRAAPENRVNFVPVREAEAIAERVPFLETAEIIAGAFGSNPPRPAETQPTLSILHYLVADRNLPESVAAEFTQQLFSLRPTLAVQHPAAHRLEVPETDRGASVPVHPGAHSYLTGEQKSFLERYSDALYLAIFGLSLGGSAIAALFGYLGLGRKEEEPGFLPEVLAMLREARATDDTDVLDTIARRADDIFVESIEASKRPGFDATRFAMLSLALERLNDSIADRRRAIAMMDDGDWEETTETVATTAPAAAQPVPLPIASRG